MSRQVRDVKTVTGLASAAGASFLVFFSSLPVAWAADAYGIKSGLSKTAKLGGIATKETNVYDFVGKAVSATLGAVGVLFLVLCIYGGFLWMTAGGNAEQVKKAQTMIVQAVIGMAVIMASYALTSFVLQSLTTAVT